MHLCKPKKNWKEESKSVRQGSQVAAPPVHIPSYILVIRQDLKFSDQRKKKKRRDLKF